MSDVRTVKIKFKDLVFLEDNPRTIKKESLERLAKRIQDDPAFFEARPCLVNFTDGKYICYGGFQRGHAAAKILKWKEVPCSVENDVATDVMRRRAILDNTHDGEWDSDVLANQWSDFSIEELGELGVPDWVFGGDDDEGEIPNNALNSEAQEDDFDPPEIETVKTDIVLGDLFEIGQHRLLCGDSTKAEDVARLMGRESADLMICDPPYGISLKYVGVMANNSDGSIEGDGNVFDPTPMFSIKANVRYFFGVNYYIEKMPSRKGVCVWAKAHSEKENLVFGASFETFWRSHRDKREIWFCPRINALPENEHKHPTQKPCVLIGRCIEDSDTNGIVIDPYAGSGTTMVTAHQIGRVARCCEIDPKYCQVIVNRMLKLDPTLEIKKNGQPYKSPNVSDLA